MLSSTALFWTEIVAALGWFIVAGQMHALWKMLRDKSASRLWSVVQGKITVSKAEGSATHPSQHNVEDTGVVIRYHYRVGDKDYEGDGARIGGKSRTMGLLAKALLKKFPEGRSVDVYYDPADPTQSALEPKGKGSVFLATVLAIVFTTISGVLTAHAIAGKMLIMSNGLPYFALGLPAAALLIGIGAFVAYFIQQRQRKASASWPTTQGQVMLSKVVEQQEREEDDDGETRVDITYRPEIRFVYRVGDTNYSSETWKPGGDVSFGAAKRAELIVARYPAGQSVTVHYDPAHPDTAVLEPTNREGAAMPLVFGFALSLAGTLMLWAFTHGHWVNAATGT